MPDVHYHQVTIRSMVAAIHKFTDRIGLAVVQHCDRQVIAVFQQLRQRQILPVKIDCVNDDTIASIDQPGSPHPNPDDRLPTFFKQAVEHLVNQLQGLTAVTITDRQFNGLFDLALQIDN